MVYWCMYLPKQIFCDYPIQICIKNAAAFLSFQLTTKLSCLQKITLATLPSMERFCDHSKQTFMLLKSTDIHLSHGLLAYVVRTYLPKQRFCDYLIQIRIRNKAVKVAKFAIRFHEALSV